MLFLISAINIASADSISGYVYKYQEPNTTNNIVTKEFQLYDTAQEYLSRKVVNAYTQYTQAHIAPNFFFYSCIGTDPRCDTRDVNGGEVYVDEFDVSGSQAELQIHTPWDTWVDAWVDRNSIYSIFYSGSDPAWQGSIYSVYLKTFIGGSNTGVFLTTQLVSPGKWNPNYFTGIGGELSGTISMPNGMGQLKNNFSAQAFFINTSAVADLSNVSSYKIRVLASLNIPGEDGAIRVWQPITGIEFNSVRFSRMTSPSFVGMQYYGLPVGVTGQNWYDLTRFNTSLQNDSIFQITLDSNIRIHDYFLVVTYNSTSVPVVEIPLKNVRVTGTYVVDNTTTNSDGYYSMNVTNGTGNIYYDGFYATTAGLPFYGELKTFSFPGGDITGHNEWLNETIGSMIGELSFYRGLNSSLLGTGKFVMGEQMNISYLLYRPDRTNYSFTIDLYKPIFDYSSDVTLDTSIELFNNSGSWLPVQDKTTRGLRNIYLNYTPLTGGTPTIMDSTWGNYGEFEANGSISTDKPRYNYSDTAVVTYNISVDGRILINCIDCRNNYNTTYAVSAGNGTLSLNINAPLEYGQYDAWLQYDFYGNWNPIAVAHFLVTPNNSIINFSQEQYILGETVQVIVYQTSNGYALLKVPNGSVKQNFTDMGIGNFSYNIYWTQRTDPAGTWNAELYSASGVQVASATTLLIDNTINVTPTPTITPVATCPGGSNICSGTPWTPVETYSFLAIALPQLGLVIFVILFLTAIVGTVNIFRGKKK